MRVKAGWILGGAALAAAAGLAAAGDEPTRLYTNADLKKYEIQEAPAAHPPSEDPSGWEFVREFLEREHSRIDAERRDRIERLEIESRSESPEPGYGVPYVGLNYGYGYGYGYGYDYRPAIRPVPWRHKPGSMHAFDVPFRGAVPHRERLGLPRPAPVRPGSTVRPAR